MTTDIKYFISNFDSSVYIIAIKDDKVIKRSELCDNNNMNTEAFEYLYRYDFLENCGKMEIMDIDLDFVKKLVGMCEVAPIKVEAVIIPERSVYGFSRKNKVYPAIKTLSHYNNVMSKLRN